MRFAPSFAIIVAAVSALVSCSPPPFACTEDGTANCDLNTANGCEVLLDTDPAHCGACDNACAGGDNASAVCTDGACGLACNEGFKDCDAQAGTGCEVDVRVTVAHCGACGQACNAPANATAKCEDSACGFTCLENFGDCDGDASNGCETNLEESADHCGQCNNACSDVTGGEGVCSGGECGFECTAPADDCDAETAGCETNTSDDADHCGGCGIACEDRDNAEGICSDSNCAIACGEGFGNCDETDANGCEESIVGNVAHCGGCGVACEGAPHAAPVCVGDTVASAACSYACNDGFGDCDEGAENGCEVDLSTSVDHCLACDNACAGSVNADPVCGAEGCATVCRVGFGDCTEDAGCETDLVGNTAHCNACGNACTAGTNAVPTCGEAGCGYTCEEGFADCDGDPANGCEVDTRNDPLNCGGCSVDGSFACPARTNAAPACGGGQCALTCNDGFGNCDAIVDNGCEEPLDSVESCGACDTTCTGGDNGSPACVLADGVASCGISCSDGFGDCDGELANGCEAPLDTDTNCGTCGNTCEDATNGVGECSSEGACTVVCANGFGNCDDDVANGCEVELATSEAHCGACGNACADPAQGVGVCETPEGGSSACDYDCNTGYGDCDAVAANGCEQQLNTTSHCLACNAACAPGDSCGATGCTSCALDTVALPLVDDEVFTYTASVSGTSRITGASCQTAGAGPEVIFPLTITERRALSVETSGYDSIVSVRRQCAVSADDLACDDDDGPGTGSGLNVTLDPGTYFIVIDRYASSPTTTGGSLVAKFRMYAPPAAGSCAAPVALTSEGLTGQDLASGAARAVEAPCVPGHSGPSRYFSYTLPAASTAVVTVTPTTAFAAAVRVLDSCDATACLASASSSSAGTSSTAVTIENRTLAGPRTFIIEVSSDETWVDAGVFGITVAESSVNVSANATCSGAIPLQEGTPITGQLGQQGGDISTACGTSITGAPLYYSVEIPPFGSVIVTATPEAGSTGFNPAVRAIDGCGSTPVCLGSSSTAAADAAETLQVGNPTAAPITAIVLVSGSSAGTASTGAFTVSAVAGPTTAPNAACATPAAYTLGSTLSDVNLAGATAALSTCGTASTYAGRALYYSVPVPAFTRATVTVTPTAASTSLNPTIRVLNACDATACVATVNASSTSGPSGAETATILNASANEATYIVVVSGNTIASGAGSFNLTSTSSVIAPNAGCAGALALTPGTPRLDQNLADGGPSVTGTGCNTISSASVLWYSTVVPAGRVMSVVVEPTSAWDPVVRMFNACGGTSCLGGASNYVTTVGGIESNTYNNTTGGDVTVYMAVANATAGVTGRFNIYTALADPTQSAANVCDAPATVTTATPFVGLATTANSGAAPAVSVCGSATVANAYFVNVEVPANGTSTVRMLPLLSAGQTAWSATLRALDACTPTQCLGSVTSAGGGQVAELTLSNDTAVPVTRLVVAAATTSSTTLRPFVVTVSSPSRYGLQSIATACEDMTTASTIAWTGSGDDSPTAVRPVPFEFRFFGVPRTFYGANANGLFQFVPTSTTSLSTAFSNVQIPALASPNAFITTMWDDLKYSADGQASSPLLERVTGEPGSRVWTIQYTRMQFYSSSADAGEMTTQIRMYEAGNVIELHYCSMPDLPSFRGSAATIGIENDLGTEGVSITVDRALPTLPTGFRLTPAP